MKRILLFLMLLSATCVSAQDVIVKKDGSTILSKVIEIGTSEVKYKKFSNQNGPTYTISKSEIQTINYENGEKEDYKVIDTPKEQFNYSNDNYLGKQMADGISAGNRLQKEKLLASAKSWSTVGYVWYWVSIIGGVVCGAIVYDKDNQTPAYIAIGSGAASGLIGLCVCRAISNNKEKAANSISAYRIIKQDFNIGDINLTTSIDVMDDKGTKQKSLGLGLSFNF